MGRQSDAKERLMAAILELIWEGSYGTLRIDDICKRAEVKKGSFYYFFPSKEDLTVEAFENYWATKIKPFLDEHFSPSLKPLDRLHGYLTAVVEHQEQVAKEHGRVLGCSVLSLACETGTQDEKVSAVVRDIFQRKRRYLESCIRDAIAEGEIAPGDSSERACGLWALIEGVLAQCRILNDIEPLRKVPNIAIAYLKASETAPPAS
jgi:TetR/AcrR family transcriptional repressor of nem operon